MRNLLRKILNEVIEIEQLEKGEYYQSINSLFLGIDNLSTEEYKKFLHKYFIDSEKVLSLLDGENVESVKISSNTFKVLIFDDGYDGYLLSFTKEGDKLKLDKYKKVNEDDVNDTDNLDDIQIEYQLNESINDIREAGTYDEFINAVKGFINWRENTEHEWEEEVELMGLKMLRKHKDFLNMVETDNQLDKETKQFARFVHTAEF